MFIILLRNPIHFGNASVLLPKTIRQKSGLSIASNPGALDVFYLQTLT